MTLFIFGFGLMLLPILFRLALKLRLGIPMLYAVLMLTAFHGWYQAHAALYALNTAVSRFRCALIRRKRFSSI